METPIEQPDAIRQEALLGLIDDTSAPVRQALLAYFTGLGVSSVPFLRRVACGSNRVLARHAAWFLGELKFEDPVAEFLGFIRSLNYELETGALLMARTVSPSLDIGRCCVALDRMAERCRELIAEPSTRREKCKLINRVLFHEWGYRGDAEHATDPRNSLIDQVLERRKGIPLSLSVVYLLVAGRLGVDLEPVGLPGHFVVGCFGEGAPFFIDPFENGAFLTSDNLRSLLRANRIVPRAGDLSPTPVREVLCRACCNLANHYAIAGETARARLFASFIAEFEMAYARHAI